MIIGAHSIVYSKDPEADRAFLRDVLGLPNVDAGEGWLIFGLPPAEVAVHPSDENDVHEFYLMCEDVEDLVEAMLARDVDCDPVRDYGWGLMTAVVLPGGGKLGIYQPRHARPQAPKAGAARRGARRKAKAPRKKAARRQTPRQQAVPKAGGRNRARSR